MDSSYGWKHTCTRGPSPVTHNALIITDGKRKDLAVSIFSRRAIRILLTYCNCWLGFKFQLRFCSLFLFFLFSLVLIPSFEFRGLLFLKKSKTEPWLHGYRWYFGSCCCFSCWGGGGGVGVMLCSTDGLACTHPHHLWRFEVVECVQRAPEPGNEWVIVAHFYFCCAITRCCCWTSVVFEFALFFFFMFGANIAVLCTGVVMSYLKLCKIK